MKIFITGASGLVGSHLVNYLHKNSQHELLIPPASQLDITRKEKVNNFFDAKHPDVIVHFAAHTNLSAAESERGDKDGRVWKINVEGTRNLAEAALNGQCYFIHVSTDYVFSGRDDDPGPYTEDHPIEKNPDRLSWYGYTKAMSEEIVRDMLKNYAIVRINNPARVGYDIKPDTIKKVLIPYDSGKTLTMFVDMHHSITDVASLTHVLVRLLKDKMTGIFHVSSENTCTPYELASYILQKSRGVRGVVQQSSLDDFYKKTGQLNRYAKTSGLDVTKTEARLDMKFGTWKEIIDRFV